MEIGCFLGELLILMVGFDGRSLSFRFGLFLNLMSQGIGHEIDPSNTER